MKKYISGILSVLFAGFIVLNLIPGLSADVSAVERAVSSPYVVNVYNEQNGLPTGEANTILQTSDGYIWIGSYGGLIRYDGATFRNYSVEGAITSSSIRSLFEDSKGRLWIGTNDSGIVMMENDIFNEITMPEDNSFLCIRDFEEGADGTIYAASNSGIGEITDNVIKPYKTEEMEGVTVYSVAEDKNGRIWGATSLGNCVIFDKGQLVGFAESELFFDEYDIYSVDSDKHGNIILGSSSNEVAVVEILSDTIEKSSFDVKKYSTGDVNTHNKVTAFGDGYILVSGINGLAVIYPDGRYVNFGEDDKAMAVNAAIADYENDIWLASSSYGVVKYSKGCFATPNNEAQINDISINATAFSNGRYYLGHDTGLIICNEDWSRVENNLTAMFEGVRIRCIISDNSGKIWIASYSENAIVCYDPQNESIDCFSAENGLAGEKARVVAQHSDGSILAGTQTGVSIIRDGKVVRTYTHEDGLENPSVLCFSVGENGEILVGSDGGGIYSIDGDNVVNHGFAQGLGEGVVLRMLKNSDDNGWFISAGSSLYYWKNNTFNRLTNFTKGAGSIFELYDKNGKLWILQNNGIIALDKNQLLSGDETDAIHYDTDHGITGSINANTWHYLSDDGRLHISTRNGISIFGFEGVSSKLPRIIINSVSVDDDVVEHPSKINLNSKAQRVTIDYSSLSFASTSELRVAYQLKGFDRKETLTDEKSGKVSYTNLPGGKYVFEVSVFNPENPAERVSCSIELNKDKLFVETPLFWAAVAAMLILVSCGIVFLAARVKINNMHRRQQEYKSIIEQALFTFAKTIDAKDRYTNGHSIRVAKYSRELARRLGMSDEEQEKIYYIALLHDIGKIGIPDHILNKPGKLTDEEMGIIQKHVDIGGEILKDFTALDEITEGAQYHHERYDGKGYSKGLGGTDIPRVARIIAVADTYDAMSSDRCYRKALSTEVILSEFNKHNGAQFDPEIVPHIIDMIENGVVPMDTE